jgi:hypothetical protein
MTHELNISLGMGTERIYVAPNLTGRSYTAKNYDRASVWKGWCPILRHINGTSIKQHWQCMYKRTIEVRSCNHFCVEKQ